MTGYYKTFYDGIKDLSIRNKIIIDSKKKYQVYVLRNQIHHTIVISDGGDKKIILGLQVDAEDSSGALTGQEDAVAQVDIHNIKEEDLEKMGEKTCSIAEFGEIADSILKEDPKYKVLTNNCQEFCKKFLEKTKLSTIMYKTDGDAVADSVVLLIAMEIPLVLLPGVKQFTEWSIKSLVESTISIFPALCKWTKSDSVTGCKK